MSVESQTEPLTIDAMILCPNCGSDRVELRASRKGGKATLDCDNCNLLEHEVIPYGGGLKIGRWVDD